MIEELCEALAEQYNETASNPREWARRLYLLYQASETEYWFVPRYKQLNCYRATIGEALQLAIELCPEPEAMTWVVI